VLAVPSAVHAHPHYEAPFLVLPSDPLVGEQVTFSSLAREDGRWDFDGDGRCNDARGRVIRKIFRRAGRYRVTLCLSENDARTTHEVLVASPQLTLAAARIVTSVYGRGRRVKVLRVRRSAQARVEVRCRGSNCPYFRRSFAPGSRLLRIRSIERRLPTGTRVAIYVTQPRRVGRYFIFRFLERRRLVRLGGCLRPESLQVVRCPD
jgi:hypothetical protein